LSQQIGVVLIQAAGLSTVAVAEREGVEGKGCNWENLAILVVMCHMVLPLFSLPLVSILKNKSPLSSDLIRYLDTILGN
jgi:hypothetical protein